MKTIKWKKERIGKRRKWLIDESDWQLDNQKIRIRFEASLISELHFSTSTIEHIWSLSNKSYWSQKDIRSSKLEIVGELWQTIRTIKRTKYEWYSSDIRDERNDISQHYQKLRKPMMTRKKETHTSRQSCVDENFTMAGKF